MQLSCGDTACTHGDHREGDGDTAQVRELTKFVTDLADVATAARTLHTAVLAAWAAGVQYGNQLTHTDEIRKLGACLDRLDVRRDKMTRP